MTLSPIEARVLGVLIEKQLTTPNQYPMSVNALQSGSNQKSNRDPVVKYSEGDVLDGLDGLRRHKLAGTHDGVVSRVPKYRHLLNRRFELKLRDTAVLCTLLLRGPQTLGEIRSRTNRMFDFRSLEEVAATLEGLAKNEPALVTKLPRRPGQKDDRYAQLLTGKPKPEAYAASTTPAASASSASSGNLPARVDALERTVAELQAELSRLKTALGE
ncbi:MAG: YceH family protein [Bacteroidota bacterium]